MRGAGEEHLRRVRRICLALPGTGEKLSHGEPTFFAGKKVFAMFANNHHNDGHIAVWIPAAPGVQAMLMSTEPETFCRHMLVCVVGSGLSWSASGTTNSRITSAKRGG